MSRLNFEDERINFTPLSLYVNYIHIIHREYLINNYENLTPVDVTYLMNIFYNSNCSQRDLSELFFVSESNVTQIIKKLEKNGFITRTPDEKNKSRKILNLTNEGKIIVFKLIKEMYEWEGDFFKDYSPEDVEKFKKMIYDYSQKTIDSLVQFK